MGGPDGAYEVPYKTRGKRESNQCDDGPDEETFPKTAPEFFFKHERSLKLFEHGRLLSNLFYSLA